MSIVRRDRFSVGDEVWWHIPTVMACCRNWSPDITKPTKIIAVKDKPLGPDGKLHNSSHTQLVRVSPNYCPYGDEFEGSWLLPIGVTSHNDPDYHTAIATDRKAPAKEASAARAEGERSELLKPCPFCGGDNTFVMGPTCTPTSEYDAADRAMPVVRCLSCGAEAFGKDFDQSKKTAITAWNLRSPPGGGGLGRPDQNLAVAICTILARMPPKDWLANDALCASIEEFRSYLAAPDLSRRSGAPSASDSAPRPFRFGEDRPSMDQLHNILSAKRGYSMLERTLAEELIEHRVADSQMVQSNDHARAGSPTESGRILPPASEASMDKIDARQKLVDYFATIHDCIRSIQGALRHRQQPQDYHFHTAEKACRDGASFVASLLACSSKPNSAGSMDPTPSPAPPENTEGQSFVTRVTKSP